MAVSNFEVKIDYVLLSNCFLLEVNAHYMNEQTYNQLVKNIKKDKQLTTTPFGVKHTEGKNEGKYEIISGNHRVSAAKDAGLTQIPLMWVHDYEVTNDQKLSIQLSHNSIGGEDDKRTLYDLVSQIEDIDYREYANIDETQFAELEKYDFTIPTPDNEKVNMNFFFIESNLKYLELVLSNLSSISVKDFEHTYLLPKETLNRFNDIVAGVQEKYNIKSYGLAILKMAQIAEKYAEHD